jgi:hypothetical protein
MFIAPAGLWVLLDAGHIASATYSAHTGTRSLTLDPEDSFTSVAHIHIETTVSGGRRYDTASGVIERNGRSIPLSSQTTQIEISP